MSFLIPYPSELSEANTHAHTHIATACMGYNGILWFIKASNLAFHFLVMIICFMREYANIRRCGPRNMAAYTIFNVYIA